MAEISHPWDGTTTGDAASAPYNDDVFGDIYRDLVTNNKVTDGVIYTAMSGFTGNLEVTNPSGVVARVATGMAMVDGKLYRNTANIDNSCSVSGFYYRLVLRKDFAAQTVTCELLGPEATIPDLTQEDADTWEIPLATVYNASGLLVITDERVYTPRYFSENIEPESITAAKLADTSTMIVLEDTILGSDGTIDWTSINQNFRTLMINYSARSTYTPGTEAFDVLMMRFNNDSAANYNGRIRDAEYSGPTITLSASGTTYISAGYLTNNSTTADFFSLGTIIIPNYTDTNFDKMAICTGVGYKFNAVIYPILYDAAGVWNDASAISRITFLALNGGTNNILTASRFTLYGIP